MNIGKIMMYGCTAAAACWMVLAIQFNMWQAALTGLGFIGLSFLYWDGS